MLKVPDHFGGVSTAFPDRIVLINVFIVDCIAASLRNGTVLILSTLISL